jgi:VCBS repeat-containing protein
MHKKLLSILALSILIASTLVGCGQASSNHSTLTILSITEGNVFVMKAGTDDWIEAEVGMSLEVGDTIKTGDGSGAEITFFDGSTIELQAGTEIEIASLDISTDTGATTITLQQTIGTTISRVTKLFDPASSYEIETPSGVAAVRGSTMIVQVFFGDPNYEDYTTLITNVEGIIYAIVHGVKLQVPVGRQAIMDGQLAWLIPLNDPPAAVNDSAITNEDTPVTVAAPGVLNNDSDPDIGDTLTVTSVDTSGTVGTVVAWNADGSFTYDPNGQFEYLQAGSSTTDSYNYTVSDGNGGTDTATVTITINGVNNPPIAISDTVTTDEDTAVTVAAPGLLNNDSDPDIGDTLTVTQVYKSGTAGVVTVWKDGSFTYDPNGQFEYLQAGSSTTDSYHYTVSDGNGGTDTATVTITINGVNYGANNQPLAVNDSVITDEDTPVTLAAPGVLNNDSDPDVGDALTVISVDTSGTAGTVTAWNAAGSFTYDPDGQFEYLQAGSSTTDNFTYTISDGHGGTDTATVTITINGVNDPPVAVDDIDMTPEDTPITIDVLNNDFDTDGDMLTVDSVTQGTNGSVINNGINVTYTPHVGFTGTDTFTYTISDGNGCTDTASVTVTVAVIETFATINVQIDTGPTASIYIWNNTTGGWATDEDTGKPVDGSNHETSDQIKVAGGYSYCVWVGVANVTYYVKNYPTGWSISTLVGGGEKACGLAAAGSNYPIHFTET